MRTITKEQIHQGDDFTELNRLSKQFEESMRKTHEEDRKKIAKAVKDL